MARLWSDDPDSDPIGDIRAAIKRMAASDYQAACGSQDRPHVVHPRATGWTSCAMCNAPVHRGDGSVITSLPVHS